jgi:hypothetical protein
MSSIRRGGGVKEWSSIEIVTCRASSTDICTAQAEKREAISNIKTKDLLRKAREWFFFIISLRYAFGVIIEKPLIKIIRIKFLEKL